MSEKQIRNNISNPDRKDRCKLASFEDYKKFMNNFEMIKIRNSIIVKNENVDDTIRQIEVCINKMI